MSDSMALDHFPIPGLFCGECHVVSENDSVTHDFYSEMTFGLATEAGYGRLESAWTVIICAVVAWPQDVVRPIRKLPGQMLPY